jgi:hypothetical protein
MPFDSYFGNWKKRAPRLYRIGKPPPIPPQIPQDYGPKLSKFTWRNMSHQQKLNLLKNKNE